MIGEFKLGQLAAPSRAISSEESIFSRRLNILTEQLCILHLSPQIAVVAITPDADISLAKLQLIWQQLYQARLLLITLRDDNKLIVNCQQPVTNWLHRLLSHALAQAASDVHLEPTDAGLRIRIRLAGELLTLQHLAAEQGRQLIAHIKVNADLDISENRRPQDGRFSIVLETTGQSHDFRVSTCAVLNGEKLVIRCLGTLQQVNPLVHLGLTPKQLDYTAAALRLSQGLILVTGPTGSGKTSTLYSLLQRLDKQTLNICTVEDPVEIRCHGINQVPVQRRRDLGFADILRCLLRQDPDVLMVGEIRDSETAKVAMQAAQTGHLVLASLHTNSALHSLQRLQALGVPNNEVSSALSLIVSQRLLRKTCQRCAGNGCQHCHEGYYGQLASFEVLPWQSQATQPTAATLKAMLAQQDLPTLSEHAQQLVTRGLTSAQQAARLSHASA